MTPALGCDTAAVCRAISSFLPLLAAEGIMVDDAYIPQALSAKSTSGAAFNGSDETTVAHDEPVCIGASSDVPMKVELHSHPF